MARQVMEAGTEDGLVGAFQERRLHCVDEGEDAGVLLPGEAGGRLATEHCAADSAERH